MDETFSAIPSSEQFLHEKLDILDRMHAFPVSWVNQIHLGHANELFNNAQKDPRLENNSLYYSRLDLGYLMAHYNQIPGQINVDGGFIVPGPKEWKKNSFPEKVIASSIAGTEMALRNLPLSALHYADLLMPDWIRSCYGVEPSVEIMNYIVSPKAAVFPFDHYSDDRKFFGGILGQPEGEQRAVPAFRFVKATIFPRIFWLSDRIENDFQQYAEELAHHYSITPERVIEEMAGHEAVHRRLVDPITQSLIIPFLGDGIKEGLTALFSNLRTLKTIIPEDVDPQDIIIEDALLHRLNPGDVLKSNLLIASIAVMYAGSPDRMIDGGVEIIKKLAEQALAVQQEEREKVNTIDELIKILGFDSLDQFSKTVLPYIQLTKGYIDNMVVN